MPVYKNRAGEEFDVPDDPTAAELAEIKSLGLRPAPSVLKDVGKSAVSGLYEGAVRAPLVVGDLATMGKNLFKEKVFGSKDTPADMPSDILLDILKEGHGQSLHVPETDAGRYTNSGMNAVGGAWLGGPNAFRNAARLISPDSVGEVIKSLIKRFGTSPVTHNAAIGAAGEFAGDVSRGFDETKNQDPLMRFLGSAAAALVPALGRHLGKNPAARPLHEVGSNFTPDDFRQAQAETARLARAGATQNTVGDAFPPGNRFSAMEREVSNEMGGAQLGNKLSGRTTGDIPRLEALARNDIQQTAVPGIGQAPGGTASYDQWVAQQARTQRSNARQTILDNGAPVPRNQIAAILRAMRTEGFDPRNFGTEDSRHLFGGARQVASVPRYPMGPVPGAPGPFPANGFTPITPLNAGGGLPPMPAGSLPGPGVPRLPGPAGSAVAVPTPAPGGIGPTILPRAPDSTFQMSGSPDITDINQPPTRRPEGANLTALSKIVKGLDTTNQVVDGPSGRVLRSAAAINARRLADRTLQDVNPDYAAAMAMHRGLSPQVNATQLLADTPNVTRANSSTRSDPMREALAAHLAQIDSQMAERVGERLRAADTLSRNTSQYGMQGLQREGTVTPLSQITPGGIFRGMGISQQRAANEMYGELLANPTPQNFRILADLARRDPDLARRQAVLGHLAAVSPATQTQGSNP